MNKRIRRYIKDSTLTLLILPIAFGVSILLQNVLNISEHVTTLFVFCGIYYIFCYRIIPLPYPVWNV